MMAETRDSDEEGGWAPSQSSVWERVTGSGAAHMVKWTRRCPPFTIP